MTLFTWLMVAWLMAASVYNASIVDSGLETSDHQLFSVNTFRVPSGHTIWLGCLAGMFGWRCARRLSMLFDWYNWCRLILFGWCSDDTVGAIRRIERMLECRWTSFVGLVSFDLCRWTNAFKRRALNECLWTMTVRWKRPMAENVTHMMWVRPFDEIRLEFQCRRAKETWHSDDSRRPGILKFRIQSLDSKRNSLQVFPLQEFLLAIFTHSKNDEAEHASHSIDATRLRISFENAKWLTRTNDNVLNGRDSGIFKITNCVCCCEGLALRCWRCIRCCRSDAHYAFGIWSSDVFGDFFGCWKNEESRDVLANVRSRSSMYIL